MKNEAKASMPEALAPHQGDWMRKALFYAGATSTEISAYLDVEPATVSRWLNGKQPVSKQTLRLWALRTGVPLEYLETGVLPDPDDGISSRITERNLAPVTYLTDRRKVSAA